MKYNLNKAHFLSNFISWKTTQSKNSRLPIQIWNNNWTALKKISSHDQKFQTPSSPTKNRSTLSESEKTQMLASFQKKNIRKNNNWKWNFQLEYWRAVIATTSTSSSFSNLPERTKQMRKRKLISILKVRSLHNLCMIASCIVPGQRIGITRIHFNSSQGQHQLAPGCKHQFQAKRKVACRSFWNKTSMKLLIHWTTNWQTKCSLNFLYLPWMKIIWKLWVL